MLRSVASGTSELTHILRCQNWDAEIVSDTRAPVQFICADGAPCQKMIVSNVNMYVESGTAVVKCESAYGTGSCLKASGTTSYAAITSTIALPAGYTSPPTLAGDLASGFATNSAIPIPSVKPSLIRSSLGLRGLTTPSRIPALNDF